MKTDWMSLETGLNFQLLHEKKLFQKDIVINVSIWNFLSERKVCGSKFDSANHPSEVDQISTRNFWELIPVQRNSWLKKKTLFWQHILYSYVTCTDGAIYFKIMWQLKPLEIRFKIISPNKAVKQNLFNKNCYSFKF